MIYEEFYIDGLEVDIKDVAIELEYTSPFFSDVSQVFSDTTKTITLPETERNKSIMQYLQSPDMNTDFPYVYHYANYYRNGVLMINHGQVNILGDWEIQVVYGINKEKYLPLKTKKINEIVANGTTILESDWIVKWNANDMFETGHKYKYLNYISTERISDASVNGTQILAKAEIPYPYKSVAKQMTMHPFIPFENILQLINDYLSFNVAIDFSPLTDRLKNKGLILGGNKDNYDQIVNSVWYSPTSYISNAIILNNSAQSYGYVDILSYQIIADEIALNVYPYSVKMELNFELNVNNSIGIYRNYMKDGNFYRELIQALPLINGKCNTIVNITEESKVGFYGQNISIEFDDETQRTYKIVGSIKTTINYQKAQFCVRDTNVYGRYNCLINLPDLTILEFIQQMLILTGLFIGYDENGDIKFLSLDEFKANTPIIYDGKVGIGQKSWFQFNSNAQKNWIKYDNSDKILYPNKESINVADLTQTSEKDLYVLKFDLADISTDGRSEIILYKQSVKSDFATPYPNITFENEYQNKNNTTVYDNNGFAINYGVLPITNLNVFKGTDYFKGYGSDIQSPYNHLFDCDGIGAYDNLILAHLSENTEIDISLYAKDGDKLTHVNGNLLAVPVFVVWVGQSTIAFEEPVNTIISTGDEFTITEGAIVDKISYEDYKPTYQTISVGDKITRIDDTDYNDLYVIANPSTNVYQLSYAVARKDDLHKITYEKNYIGFIPTFYSIYQKVVNRPIVKEVSMFLTEEEISDKDKYSKQWYIKEWGKYCMLLHLTAPNKGLCIAKLLLINQTL
jgi:hypothetical protein